MSSTHSARGALAFAKSYLSSVDELPVLLSLIESAYRWWDAKMVAGQLGISASAASQILELLAARNLLDIRVTDQVRYQFRPTTPDVQRAALEFVEECRRDPAAIAAYLMTPRRTA